jgi:hypothetical protein
MFEQAKLGQSIKGIVSPDWKGLHMFSLDRFEVERKPLYVKKNLNGVFTTHVFKVAPNHVRFTPGFPPGAGFHGEELAPAWFETIM